MTALATAPQSLAITDEQKALIKRTICKDATDDELKLFLFVCENKKLDPLTKQIYMIKSGGKMFVMSSIDGLRAIAQRSGKYMGQDGPYWCGEDGVWKEVWAGGKKPVAAKVGVYRQGHDKPTYGVVHYDSFVKNSPTWNAMPEHMLAIRAEANALKKVFPEECGGIYIDGEIDEDKEPEYIEPPVPKITDEQLKLLHALQKNSDWKLENVKEFCMDKFSLPVRDINAEQFTVLIAAIKKPFLEAVANSL